MFNSDTAYTNYLKTASTQRLKRAILKLFPNTPVSVSLFRSFDNVTATKPFANTSYTDFVNISSLNRTDTSSNFNRSIGAYLNSTALKPVSSRVATVEKILDENGYTASKRASMSNDVIGIQIADDVVYETSDKDNENVMYSGLKLSQYPNSSIGESLNYHITIAKAK
ncbi:hypothetical protein AYR62_14180 [Secundilactobacillus paracollinoides]|uniref:hypothetical protein n=1 Tax=Secundilactobacillus paracollinoides TaxID=240427 RepID=UPI00081A885B|nr:hypothetical protein [Secundilactobacillus paracollinoides]ANZ65114.1 hypothetical protein AYR62_14180 [Secundilactobacillus paracollinoides]